MSSPASVPDRVVVAVSSTADDASFAGAILAAAELDWTCEEVEEHGVRAWRILVPEVEGTAARLRLRAVPEA